MWLESLENRNLLTTIDVIVNLYQDNGGVPGALINNNAVTVGDSFFVEVLAKDTSAVPSGISGLALDISFDPTALEEIDSPFNPSNAASPLVTSTFDFQRGGTLDNATGKIDELRGGSLGNFIGLATHERFSLMHFKAESAIAGSLFGIDIGSGGVGFDDGSNFNLAGSTIEAQTITVLENGAGPSLFTIDDVTKLEGTGGGPTLFTFTVKLSPAFGGNAQVDVKTIDKSATSPADFASKTATLFFPIGVTEQQFTVEVVQDAIVEGTETFEVFLFNPDGPSVGDDTGVGTILDDDNRTVTIAKTVSQVEGNAGNNNFDFTVTLSDVSATDVVVPWKFANGTSTAADFGAGFVTAGNITILAGKTTAIIPIPVNGDTTVELDDTFTVTLETPLTNGVTLGANTVGDGTIQNDDSATIVITGPAPAAEGNAGNTAREFTVTLSNPVDVNVTVNFDTKDGTATTAGNDYVPVNGQLTFNAGSTTAQKISVNVVGDKTVEPDEQFSVELSGLVAGAPARNVTIQTASANALITNDDAATLTITSPTIVEGNAGTKTLKFSVALDQPVANEVTVELNTQDGTATTAGSDYVAKTQTLTFPANSTAAQDFEVTINGDTLVEADETFSVLLSKLNAGASTVNLPAAPGVGTIQNDDFATVSIDSVTLPEGNAGTTDFQFTVSLDNVVDFDFDIPWTFTHGTTNNADFTNLTTTGKVTISKGADEGTIKFQVTGDTKLEANETFNVTLGTPSNASIKLAANPTGVGTINNDDSVIVSINDLSFSEPQFGSTKNYDFVVSLDQAADIDVVVPYTIAHVTTANADFSTSPVGTGTVTITKGTTSAQIPSITAVPDLLTEGTETFTVTLGTPETAGAALSQVPADTVGTGTIVDTPAPVASIDSKTLAEGNSGATAFNFTVTLDQTTPVEVTIPWTLANVSTTDADFFAGQSKTGTVTIPANSKTGTIAISVNGDTALEANDTFTVTLGTPTTANAVLNDASKVGTGTITNDDQVTVTINNVTDNEPANGNTKDYAFTVTLSQAAEIDVVVPWKFANVTTTDADFSSAPPGTGTVTITKGSTTANITGKFVVTGDQVTETPETFTVTLQTPETTGAVLGGASVGTGTINDNTITATIGDKTLAEGNSGTTAFEFTVTLDKANPDADVVIPFTLANGTTTDADFAAGQAKTGNVTIAKGSTTGKISIGVNGDTTLEADNTFTVTLGTPVTANVVLGADKVGDGVITNDDQVTVSITQTVTQTEGNSGTKNFDFTVSLDKAAEIDVVVPWNFAHSGTNPTNAADFTGLTTSGTVTIAAGSTSKVIPSFQVNGDTKLEADETFTVTLATPPTAGAVLSATNKVGTGTVTNDDSVTASIGAVTKAEGNSGTTAFDFEVSIDQAADVPVVIPWTFAHGTTDATDFSGLTTTGKVTIAAGDKTAKVTFSVNGDTTVENDENFTVTLNTPETSGVNLSSTAKIGTGVIQNDDSASVSITKTVTQNEGNSGTTNFEFTVTLDKAVAFAVTIPWTFANVTTTDGDFAGSLTKSGTVTIPANTTSIKIPVFPVNGDTTVEGDETFTVTLGTPDKTGVTLAADKVGTGTVTNDDSAIVNITGASEIEPATGTKTITFPVSLTQPVDVDTTVTYTLTQGTTSAADFSNLVTTGTVAFKAGSKDPVTPLTFSIASDAITETEETFTVTLSNPTFAGGVNRNVTVGAAATGKILQDPGTAKLSGFAYVDSNKNGVKDANEAGIPGVTVTLTGTPTGGAALTLTAMTADNGSYSFTNLKAGTYEITETQPGTMFDGTDVVGTQGGTLGNDKISAITLDAAEEGTGNNFGELGLLPQFVTKRLFLASTPAPAQTLRVLNGRAAEIAGNQTLADQIFNATVPSVVAAPAAAAAAANQTAAESPAQSAGEEPQASGNSMSAGESVEETLNAAAAPAASTPSVTPKTSKSATPAASSNTSKTNTKTAAKSTTSSTAAVSASRRNAIRSLSRVAEQESNAPAQTPLSTMQLMALDDVLAREKKWR